ncbi:MAG: hypothetical protein RMX96_17580 [Nostoc sp. ChiSLP02]|nr:hypothetical protein [Nostoc sp. DedSLP05]MDZ8100089.1 hypothetical protein [Nostoc sp. DedSLP01]MDZ8186646.1 hypothetical protein [Nostoc sp. ChiSLP02]
MSNPDQSNSLSPQDKKRSDSLNSENIELTIESSKDLTQDPPSKTEAVKVLTSVDGRKTFKLLMSMFLGGSLWFTLIVLIGFNYWTVNQLTQKLADLKADDKDSHIKDAIAANNDTARGLYAFLTPLAAGVTSYYFNLVNSSDNKNNQEEKE